MTLHALNTHAQAAHARPDVPEHLLAALARAAEARRAQLAGLPATPDGPVDPADAVAAAHRASVERILTEILRAQDRVDAGTYGRCGTCSARIPVSRLELRPWSALCVRCGMR